MTSVASGCWGFESVPSQGVMGEASLSTLDHGAIWAISQGPQLCRVKAAWSGDGVLHA